MSWSRPQLLIQPRNLALSGSGDQASGYGSIVPQIGYRDKLPFLRRSLTMVTNRLTGALTSGGTGDIMGW